MANTKPILNWQRHSISPLNPKFFILAHGTLQSRTWLENGDRDQGSVSEAYKFLAPNLPGIDLAKL
jgi:hypothetical protein